MTSEEEKRQKATRVPVGSADTPTVVRLKGNHAWWAVSSGPVDAWCLGSPTGGYSSAFGPTDRLGWGSLTSGPNLNPHSSFCSTFFSHCRMRVSQRCFEGRGPHRERGGYTQLMFDLREFCNMYLRGKNERGKKNNGFDPVLLHKGRQPRAVFHGGQKSGIPTGPMNPMTTLTC